jgi:hypothetical protein
MAGGRRGRPLLRCGRSLETLDGAGRLSSAFFQSLAAIVLKVVLGLVPTRVKAAIAATAINAAIKAYSMAVTPDSSRIRLQRMVRKRNLLR